MRHVDPEVELSNLSRTVTLDGVTGQVRIFRRRLAPRWALVVVTQSGMATLWDKPFDSELDALAAFHSVVQEEGMGIFLDDGENTTVH